MTEHDRNHSDHDNLFRLHKVALIDEGLQLVTLEKRVHSLHAARKLPVDEKALNKIKDNARLRTSKNRIKKSIYHRDGFSGVH